MQGLIMNTKFEKEMYLPARSAVCISCTKVTLLDSVKMETVNPKTRLVGLVRTNHSLLSVQLLTGLTSSQSGVSVEDYMYWSGKTRLMVNDAL